MENYFFVAEKPDRIRRINGIINVSGFLKGDDLLFAITRKLEQQYGKDFMIISLSKL